VGYRARRGTDPEDERLVGYWLDSNMSLKKAARCLGITKYRLYRAIQRMGIPERVRKEHRRKAWEATMAHAGRAKVCAPEVDRRRHGVKDHPAACARCGWLIKHVTIFRRYRVPYLYDDLCFPCWYEYVKHEPFQVGCSADRKEVLRLAREYNIAAIPTEYRGMKFRSRLEARWAIFFDRLGLHWEYEPEAYALPDHTGYMPDFWIAELKCYVEIKGNTFLPVEREKAAQLARGTGYPVYIFTGPPLRGDDTIAYGHPFGYCVADDLSVAGDRVWKQCEDCGRLGLVAYSDLVCECGGGLTEESETLITARNAARNTRFDGWLKGTKKEPGTRPGFPFASR